MSVSDMQRGEIREGDWADLVLFNPQTIRDVADFNAPRRHRRGVGQWCPEFIATAKRMDAGKGGSWLAKAIWARNSAHQTAFDGVQVAEIT